MAWRRLGLCLLVNSFHPSLELTKKFDCPWTGVFSSIVVERYVDIVKAKTEVRHVFSQ